MVVQVALRRLDAALQFEAKLPYPAIHVGSRGHAWYRYDMRRAVHPSAAVAELLRKRREELGLTLREVAAQAGALGDPIPFTVIAKVERGLVDPGFRRLNLLLRLYQLPSEVACDLADLEQLASAIPANPLVGYEEAIRQWKAGDIKKGVGLILALKARTSDDPVERVERQKALLGFAIAAASLSKFRLSRHIIEELLLEPPDASLLVQVLVQGATCWHRLGSGELALALLARAEHHIGSKEHQKRAWVHHNRASTLVTLRRFAEADGELRHALKAYVSAEDTYGEGRGLGVLVHLKTEQGDLRAALDAARAAQKHARKHKYERLRIMRRIDEGAILLRLDETEAGIAALNDALAGAISVQDQVCQFHAHYHQWKAYERLRDPVRSAFELHAAQHHVRFLDETTPEAVEVRKTIGKTRPSTSDTTANQTSLRARRRPKQGNPSRSTPPTRRRGD